MAEKIDTRTINVRAKVATPSHAFGSPSFPLSKVLKPWELPSSLGIPLWVLLDSNALPLWYFSLSGQSGTTKASAIRFSFQLHNGLVRSSKQRTNFNWLQSNKQKLYYQSFWVPLVSGKSLEFINNYLLVVNIFDISQSKT